MPTFFNLPVKVVDWDNLLIILLKVFRFFVIFLLGMRLDLRTVL